MARILEGFDLLLKIVLLLLFFSAGDGVSEIATVAQEKEIVHVEHCKGIDGFDKVILREVRGCSTEVYLYGGHVTSWKNEHGEELLFLSSKAKFVASKAIRGGIPICFPQMSIVLSKDSKGVFQRVARSLYPPAMPLPPPKLMTHFP